MLMLLYTLCFARLLTFLNCFTFYLLYMGYPGLSRAHKKNRISQIIQSDFFIQTHPFSAPPTVTEFEQSFNMTLAKDLHQH